MASTWNRKKRARNYQQHPTPLYLLAGILRFSSPSSGEKQLKFKLFLYILKNYMKIQNIFSGKFVASKSEEEAS